MAKLLSTGLNFEAELTEDFDRFPVLYCSPRTLPFMELSILTKTLVFQLFILERDLAGGVRRMEEVAGDVMERCEKFIPLLSLAYFSGVGSAERKYYTNRAEQIANGVEGKLDLIVVLKL